MESLLVQPKTRKQLTAIKSFLKALWVDFKYAEQTEREKSINLYGKDSVEKIEQADEDIKAGGRTVTYSMSELEKLSS